MNEEMLIAGLRRGDPAARKKLYELYAPAMMSVCVRYAGNRETARDLLQDGFIKVFTKIPTYAATGAFGGWVRRIFVTTALEYLRKEQAHSDVDVDAYEDSLEDVNYSALDKLSADELLACVARLPAGYALPLSFGLMARKNLNDRLALESGLVYTYLSSRFASSGSLSRKARLELHYLGIPLNLVVYAWNHPRWKVYFTAGGMVEKGLKSLYSRQVYREGELAVLSRKEGMGGLQWSLHFSAGADYRFYKAWSYYLEPRLSRYYDNGQPASYRTAHAWSLGLGGGIRYEF